MIDQNNIFSVSSLNLIIKEKIESEPSLMAFMVKGELTSFNGAATNGHYYFALKDDRSQIDCVLFSSYAYRLDPLIKNGDEVLISGSLKVYLGRGRYQIVVYSIERFGVGNKLIELEKLKKKLYDEGLFDPIHKKSLPLFPTSVGIISAKDSAALADIIKNINNRYPLVSIKKYEALMQGEGAPKDIIRALKIAKEDILDVVVIARGGGSELDLDAFNNEELAREVFDFPYPIVSAIGHEINTTILDMVADKRASTPTEAAVLITPDKEELYERLASYEYQLDKYIFDIINKYQEKVSNYALHPFLKDASYLYEKKRDILSNNKKMLYKSIDDYITIRFDRLEHSKHALKNLDVNNVLKRGYSLQFNENGKLITSTDEVKVGEEIKTQLKDGIITSSVLNKKKKEKDNG